MCSSAREEVEDVGDGGADKFDGETVGCLVPFAELYIKVVVGVDKCNVFR